MWRFQENEEDEDIRMFHILLSLDGIWICGTHVHVNVNVRMAAAGFIFLA
jgi:hypothetical protein